jgi:ribosomal protein S18 acetylase RimI-like enzyme
MEISHRKLVADDSKQYRAIRLESLKLHPENFGVSFEEQSKLSKLMFEKALEQPLDDRFVMGAFDQHILIGICGFLPFVPENNQQLKNTGTVIQVYVKSEYRGRKIGLGLIKAVLHEAFKIPNMEQVVLGVHKGNMSAIRIYEQAGLQIYDLAGYETENNKDGLRMIIHRDS